MHAQFGACGRFQLQITRPDGATRIAADWQPNLLTDAGLKSFGGNYNGAFYNPDAKMQVGTGAGTPAATDTALFNLVASVTRFSSYNNQGGDRQAHTTTPPYYKSATFTWVFGKGAAAGNLTELGVRSYQYSSDKLLSHALIKDSTGTPTAITVAADEVLTVVYELRFYLLDTSDQTGTVTLDGVATAFTLRPSRVDAYDFKLYGIFGDLNYYLYFYDTKASLGSITGTPVGGSNIDARVHASIVQTPISLNNGVVSRSATFTVPATQMNDLGDDVKIIRMIPHHANQSIFEVQIEFNPPFTKDNTKEFAFTLTATWQRYTP